MQPRRTLNEVMNALGNCGQHDKCCIGCPYQNDLHYGTCQNTMHYDAFAWMSELRVRADSLKIKVMQLEKQIKNNNPG